MKMWSVFFFFLIYIIKKAKRKLVEEKKERVTKIEKQIYIYIYRRNIRNGAQQILVKKKLQKKCKVKR